SARCREGVRPVRTEGRASYWAAVESQQSGRLHGPRAAHRLGEGGTHASMGACVLDFISGAVVGYRPPLWQPGWRRSVRWWCGPLLGSLPPRESTRQDVVLPGRRPLRAATTEPTC